MFEKPNPMSLRDYFDISSFQCLLDSFGKLSEIATAILDLKGEVFVASGWKRICREFHRKCPGTAARCLESDTILAGKLPEGERYHIYKCRNGLIDISSPIYVDNIHIGTLFIGQFLFEPPDMEFFSKQAEKFGFDKTQYLEALSEVPVLSEERMNHAIEFLTHLTKIIGDIGIDKKNLAETNRNLEFRIQDRTAELAYSNERLRVLSEAAFEGLVLTENGNIIDANKQIAGMFGYHSASEVLGLPVLNFITPEKREDVRKKVMARYDKPFETKGIRRDGSLIPIEVIGKMFMYQGRRVWSTAVRDLTLQKKAEHEIQILRNILPICTFCKKIRDDKGYWEQVDIYIRKNSDADFSHSICPDCMKKYYPDL